MDCTCLDRWLGRRRLPCCIFVAAACLGVLSHASGAISAEPEAKDPKPPKASRTIPSGIGGMAWLDDERRLNEGRLLVVHDTKVGSVGPRIGVLHVGSKMTPTYREAMVNWKAAGGEANDLEAIALIPDRFNEFLALESGFYNGKYGRLIRLRAEIDAVNLCRVETISAWKLPSDTVSLEGLVCVKRDEGKYLVIVGERGGDVSAEHVSGKLRCTEIDIDRPGELKFDAKSELPIRIPTEGWNRSISVRGCADLFVDLGDQLWCVAAEDPGDAGPFRSVIFQVGEIDHKADIPIKPVTKVAAQWTFDGLKVEAVAERLAGVGVLSVATDDENYGAMWRPIGSPIVDSPPTTRDLPGAKQGK